MKFKEGDIVICLNEFSINGISNIVTKGNLYTVLRVELTVYQNGVNEYSIFVIDDRGNETGWMFDRFELYVKPNNFDDDLFVL